MCGFAGFTGYLENGKDVLTDMMNKIIHRGPVSAGQYIDDKAYMGFRRLSIIDLDNGSQPMFNENKKIVITFNGEIYNYQDLRKDLIEKGHIFANNSDTEVLIHAYEEYGEDMLNKLRGMFAFVIWDSEKETLFGARDFFGIKPVYYAEIDGHFVFASEIKSILAFPGYERKVNQKALEQYLSFQYSPLEETFFKGIYKLMPGHMLLYKNGSYEIKTYFKPKLTPGQWNHKTNMAQLRSQLSEILKDSVKHHMLSDVEVGAFLSGGVDSGYLASSSGADQAFTVGFDEGDRYSEVNKAAKVAEKAGLKHHVKIISKQEFWDALPDVMYHMDEPLADASAVALYFLSKEAAGHVKVVLSGEGADELFGGYNIYREPEALKKVAWIPFRLRRAVRKLAAKLPDVKGRDFLIRAGMKVEERFIGNAYIYREKEKAQILKNKVTGPSTQEYLRPFYEELEAENRGSLQDMEKMQSVDLSYWLPGDILQKADKMSMAHSLEVRVPFLDKEVFDFAAKLPKETKIAAGTTKYIFRKAVSKFLPQETDERKKLGFPIPIRVWLRQDDWYQMVTDLFTSKAAEEFFRTEELLQLLKDHKNKKADNSRKIWTVLTFLIWYDRFFATCSKGELVLSLIHI